MINIPRDTKALFLLPTSSDVMPVVYECWLEVGIEPKQDSRGRRPMR